MFLILPYPDILRERGAAKDNILERCIIVHLGQ